VKPSLSNIKIEQTQMYVVETIYREFSIQKGDKHYKLIKFGDEVELLLAQGGSRDQPRFRPLGQQAIDQFIHELKEQSKHEAQRVPPLNRDKQRVPPLNHHPHLEDEDRKNAAREESASPSELEDFVLPSPIPEIVASKTSATIISSEELLALLEGLD